MQPSMAEINFLKKVELALREKCEFYSVANPAVVVALSGGPDSVALLKALTKLVDKHNIYAVHINHMLRGAEADNDQAYCEELCNKLGVSFYTFNVDVKKYATLEKVSIEVAARILRHAKLQETADKIKKDGQYDAVCIALGHNLNDKAETVMLNIGRGTGLKGLCSMDYINSQERLIRPLLAIARDEIEAYAEDLHPAQDATNNEIVYTRNKIRNQAIPLLSEIFDRDMTKMLSDMSNNLKDDNDYIERQARNKFGEYFDPEMYSLDTAFAANEHKAISYRIIRLAISYLLGNLVNISSEHIDAIFKLCVNNKSSKKIQLPNGLNVEYKYNRLFFRGQNSAHLDEANAKRFDIKNAKHEIFENTGCLPKTDIKSETMYFDYDKLLAFADGRKLALRYRMPGDVIKPYRGNGTKKVKKYFIDNKVDCEIREHIPLLAVDDDVVWIVGFTMDDRFRVTEETKRILKIQCNNENGGTK